MAAAAQSLPYDALFVIKHATSGMRTLANTLRRQGHQIALVYTAGLGHLDEWELYTWHLTDIDFPWLIGRTNVIISELSVYGIAYKALLQVDNTFKTIAIVSDGSAFGPASALDLLHLWGEKCVDNRPVPRPPCPDRMFAVPFIPGNAMCAMAQTVAERTTMRFKNELVVDPLYPTVESVLELCAKHPQKYGQGWNLTFNSAPARTVDLNAPSSSSASTSAPVPSVPAARTVFAVDQHFVTLADICDRVSRLRRDLDALRLTFERAVQADTKFVVDGALHPVTLHEDSCNESEPVTPAHIAELELRVQFRSGEMERAKKLRTEKVRNVTHSLTAAWEGLSRMERALENSNNELNAVGKATEAFHRTTVSMVSAMVDLSMLTERHDAQQRALREKEELEEQMRQVQVHVTEPQPASTADPLPHETAVPRQTPPGSPTSTAQKKTKRSDADTGDCNVCMDKKPNCLFLPCRHMRTCGVCAAQLDKCPECRARIEDKIVAFV